MILWRISEFPVLDGRGGMVVAGRWHNRGAAVAYLADSSALAMLEVLVHLETDRIPPPFQLIRIEAADDVPRSVWNGDRPPANNAISRAWGDAWLAGGETALAVVPSIVAPGGSNLLLNPRHPDADRVHILAAGRWPWDARLFGR